MKKFLGAVLGSVLGVVAVLVGLVLIMCGLAAIIEVIINAPKVNVFAFGFTTLLGFLLSLPFLASGGFILAVVADELASKEKK